MVASMTAYKTVNPATGETLKEFPEASAKQIETALADSHAAYQSWRNSDVETRSAVLRRVGEIYQERKDELAGIISLEMGKPLAQAKGEIDIVTSIYEYYATQGPGFLADEELSVSGGGTATVRTAPLGSLLGIMPWNFPYYQVARFAAPNLMLGNTILLKHAPSCPQAALAMEQIFTDSRPAERRVHQRVRDQ